MNVRLIVLAAGLGATALGTVASAQQQFPVNNPAATRSNRGSDQNLRREIHRLEGVIDMLQRDRHDYGGHRVAAIADLQRAREQLEQGLQFDNNH
jgi:hypothetical protein